MWKMLQMEEPKDYLIASGKTYTLRDFIKIVFKKFNLDYKKYLIVDKSLYRPLDIIVSKVNPKKANKELNWESKHSLDKLIDIMIK